MSGSHNNAGQTTISASGSDVVITFVSGLPAWGGFVFTGLTVGYVYSLNLTALGTYGYLRVGTSESTGIDLGGSGSGVVRTEFFVASATTHYLNFGFVASQGPITVSSLSLKEINPLSVSIQMDGQMTYADTDLSREVQWYTWEYNTSNFIDVRMSTVGTRTGQPYFYHRATASGQDIVGGGNTYFSPEINVPFNLAARHGSTFINGATDGTALTADLTPTALPDLSATDFRIGSTFMGNIGRLRVWADDISNTGIAEAST